MSNNISSQVAQGDFLTLLTVQLRHQDPVNPVKQEEFVGQLTQFSILEGIEGLNTSFGDMMKLQEISQGMDLVGREVDYLNTSSNQIETGTVSEFFVDQGLVKLMVNGNAIGVDLISSVRHPDESA